MINIKYTLADSGGGANLRFFMPKKLIFLNLFSLASLAINFKHHFKRNMAKTR